MIDAIGSGTSKTLPHPYALLNEVLAKTMIWQPLPDELQARVAAEWGVEGLVEVVVVSGFYQMFATIKGFWNHGSARLAGAIIELRRNKNGRPEGRPR